MAQSNLTGATLRVFAAKGNYKPKTDYMIVENDGTDAGDRHVCEWSLSNLAFLTPVRRLQRRRRQ